MTVKSDIAPKTATGCLMLEMPDAHGDLARPRIRLQRRAVGDEGTTAVIGPIQTEKFTVNAT